MPKLNQILAVEKGAKENLERAAQEAFQTAQRPEAFIGQSRVYEAKQVGEGETGETKPPEHQFVQQTVKGVVNKYVKSYVELTDVNATKVWANTTANADVTMPDGTVLVEGAPVEFLLFLEQRLAELRKFVARLPTLDPGQRWQPDPNQEGHYRTEPVRQNATKKVMKTHVAYPATADHPAQVQNYQEDEVIGYWDKTLFSGAVYQTQIDDWLAKIDQVGAAVKFAREEANSLQVDNKVFGEAIFNHIFPTII